MPPSGHERLPFGGRRRGPSAIDSWVEQAGRWSAGRLTRRSFLGKVGRAGVLIAAGPAMAAVLTRTAAAQVCGQTGYADVCPTFHCEGGTWGWCWYASGCCAGGRLKKICDCCVNGYYNVQGYCPNGTSVLCLVQSCGADPRVQGSQITWWMYSCVASYGPPHRVLLGGHSGVLDNPGYLELQSILNGFETWPLRGGAGDGFPFEQPWYQLDIGGANVDYEAAVPSPRPSSSYWTGRARPK